MLQINQIEMPDVYRTEALLVQSEIEEVLQYFGYSRAGIKYRYRTLVVRYEKLSLVIKFYFEYLALPWTVVTYESRSGKKVSRRSLERTVLSRSELRRVRRLLRTQGRTEATRQYWKLLKEGFPDFDTRTLGCGV